MQNFNWETLKVYVQMGKHYCNAYYRTCLWGLRLVQLCGEGENS